MRLIKSYSFKSLNDWHRAETRIFRTLEKLSLDELRDIATYWGMDNDFLTNKTYVIKCIMVAMGNTLSNKHFTKLKTK